MGYHPLKPLRKVRRASRLFANPVDAGPSIVIAMKGRLVALARMLGSGFLYSAFGVGAVVLAGVVIPIAVRLKRGDEPNDIRAQRWTRCSFSFFMRLSSLLRMIDAEYSGFDQLSHGSCLVVANHPTLLDVVVLLSEIPQVDCVVKSEAWHNPALRLIVGANAYIPNDDGEKMIDVCASRLQAGRKVLLFPEGSRSPEGGLLQFKRGAARVALRSGHPIVPVVIRCKPPALRKGQPWYALPKEELHYTVTAGERVLARDIAGEGASRAIAARQVTRWLYDYFTTRLDDHDGAAPPPFDRSSKQ